MNKTLLLLIIIFSFVIHGCAKNQNIKEVETNIIKENPEIMYQVAMKDLQDEKYDLALKKFKDLNFKFPLSNEAVKSQMMMGFIEYINLNYDEAIFIFDQLINKFPSHKDIDYVFYMKAICYYEQIESEELDGYYNIKSLESFKQVINRFPSSEYFQDSNQKVIAVKENIAAKEMNIGLFYLERKKYLAAMNRFKKVIDKYDTSKFVPEALYRLVETYYSLGMYDDAKKTASTISYNYPNSKWYKYSYDLLTEEKNNKSSILKKISNMINKNDREE